jgi:hypothetical protein
MKFLRVILLLLLATALFVVFRYFVPRKLETEPALSTKSQDQAVSAKETSKLLLGSREELESFSLTRKSLYLKIAKEKEGWRLTSPIEGPVRSDFLNMLFRNFHTGVLESPFFVSRKKFREFGLDPPVYQVTFTTTASRKQRTLLIGDDTPAADAAYAMWQGGNRIYLLKGDLKAALKSPLSSIRTEQLFSGYPDSLARLEVNWEKNAFQAALQPDSTWRLSKPTDIPLDNKRVRDYAILFWALKIKAFPEEGKVMPAIPEKYYVKLERSNRKPCTLWIGPLDPAQSAYPVFYQEENLRVWIARKDLEPLLILPYDSLAARNFVNFPREKVYRVKISLAGQDFWFVLDRNLWHEETSGGPGDSFPALDLVLSKLKDLEYVKSLNIHEKAAILLDPAEIGLTVSLYQREAAVSFMEFKFYIRDYAYLEINGAAPLYVLPQESVEPLFAAFEPLLQK